MEKRLRTVADLTVLDGEEEPAPNARNAGSPKPLYVGKRVKPFPHVSSFGSRSVAMSASRFLSCFCAFFCSTAPQAFFRPDRGCPTPTRAEAVKAGRRSDIEAHSAVSRPRLDSLEHGGRLDGHGLEELRLKGLGSGAAMPRASDGSSRFPWLLVLWSGAFRRSSATSMGSCENRITLYPAAPLRLATLLHARTIA